MNRMKRIGALALILILVASGFVAGAPAGTAAASDVRVNAGGPSYTDGAGNVWSADFGFSGGTVYSNTKNIAGTTDDTLYRTERYGAMTYTFSVADGAYNVTLRVAETLFTAAGQRKYDVAINSVQVQNDFDIYAACGANTACDRTFPVTVTNGQVQIVWTAVVQNPKINAIQVVPSTAPTATPTALPTATPSPPTATPTSSCNGTQIVPGDNLPTKINGKTNTTFCIRAGTYNIGSATIKPGNGVKLIGDPVTRSSTGAISAPSKIVGTSVNGIIEFPGASTGVVIENLDISGASGAKDNNDPATKQYGRGINGNGFSPPGVKVRYSRIHNNTNTGIAGLGNNALIEFLELDNNGSSSFIGCCAGGVKSANSYTIRNSYVHHNTGNGVWQDVAGTGFVVTDNQITFNTLSGVRYEHNQDAPGTASILRNTVKNNNTSQKAGDAGGIIINSAPNADIGSNILGGNFNAGVEVGGSRGPVSGTNIHDNTKNGDAIIGCTLSGVTCTNNT